ncbi:NAD-dependent protein deacylase [Halobacteriaceae archaeon GCM10025711]
MNPQYRRVGRAIAEADTVVALTGAGVSTASGIPDFRGDDGIWDRYDPDEFTIWRFQRDPDGFWADWLALHDAVFDRDVAPNPAHDALATLESQGALDAVVTQNVDGLHQAAGSERVVELHGSGDRAVCQHCGARTDADPVMERARDGDGAPTCDDCGGLLKPDSVLFGEQLPRHALLEAQSLAERSDVFIAAGSSLTVEPAASLPGTAERRGATLVVANDEETPVADRAAFTFRESVTEVLPALAAAVEDAR